MARRLDSTGVTLLRRGVGGQAARVVLGQGEQGAFGHLGRSGDLVDANCMKAGGKEQAGRELAAMLPHAQRATPYGVDHSGHEDDGSPLRVAQVLRDFFTTR